MKKIFTFIILFSLPLVLPAQRGKTGDKTFAHRFPADVINENSNASLLVKNTVDHDIIVCIRDQYKKYISHIYIRNKEEYLFEKLPIDRIYVQYKSKAFFYEDKQKTVVNFGEKHTFTFFYDASMEGNFIVISEEEFFSP